MIPAIVDYGDWLDGLTFNATVSGYWEDSTYSYDVPSQTLSWSFSRVGELADLIYYFPEDPEGEPGDWVAQLSPAGILDWDEFIPLLCFNDVQRPGPPDHSLERALDFLRPAPFFYANSVNSPTGAPERSYTRTRTKLDPEEGEDPEVVEQTRYLGFSQLWWPRWYFSTSYDQNGGYDLFWMDQDTTGWSEAQWRDLRRTYSTFIDGGGSDIDIDLDLVIS
jgi:hypothetical protein